MILLYTAGIAGLVDALQNLILYIHRLLGSFLLKGFHDPPSILLLFQRGGGGGGAALPNMEVRGHHDLVRHGAQQMQFVSQGASPGLGSALFRTTAAAATAAVGLCGGSGGDGGHHLHEGGRDTSVNLHTMPADVSRIQEEQWRQWSGESS